MVLLVAIAGTGGPTPTTPSPTAKKNTREMGSISLDTIIASCALAQRPWLFPYHKISEGWVNLAKEICAQHGSEIPTPGIRARYETLVKGEAPLRTGTAEQTTILTDLFSSIRVLIDKLSAEKSEAALKIEAKAKVSSDFVALGVQRAADRMSSLPERVEPVASTSPAATSKPSVKTTQEGCLLEDSVLILLLVIFRRHCL